MDNNGKVLGLKNSKKLMEDIPNKIRDVLGIIAETNLYTEDGNEYIEIVVKPSLSPINYKGEYHYRTGSTKQALSGAALNDFLLKRSGHSWDDIPVETVSIDELRSDSFDIFREHSLRSKRMTEEDLLMNNEELLDSLGLYSGKHLSRAAVLSFYQKPERIIGGASIKIGFFEDDAEIIYQDELHGSLMEQADKIIDLIYTKYLKAIISYDDVTRVETYPFPKEGIREAVYNAIVHKNYASLIPIQIRIYENKLQISNSCVLPDDYDLTNLLEQHASDPHNPKVANAFYRAGFIESWGRGIEKICKECDKYGIPWPKYSINRGMLSVLFENNTSPKHPKPRQTTDKNLSDRDMKILEIIKDNPKVTHKDISTLVGISIRQSEEATKHLRENNIIRRINGKRYGAWEIIEEPNK